MPELTRAANEVLRQPNDLGEFGLAGVASALTTPTFDRVSGFPFESPNTSWGGRTRSGCRTTYAWGVAHLLGDSIRPLTTCATWESGCGFLKNASAPERLASSSTSLEP